jgi:hypothetical protein
MPQSTCCPAPMGGTRPRGGARVGVTHGRLSQPRRQRRSRPAARPQWAAPGRGGVLGLE